MIENLDTSCPRSSLPCYWWYLQMANSLCIAEDRLKTNKTQDLGTVAHDEWHLECRKRHIRLRFFSKYCAQNKKLPLFNFTRTPVREGGAVLLPGVEEIPPCW